MGIMVYSLLWVMQDFVHQPLREMQPQNIRAQITGARKMAMFEKGGLAHAVRLRLSSARLSP